MLNPTPKKSLALTALAGMLSLSSCEYFKDYLPQNPSQPLPGAVQLKNHSVTPALIKAMPGFEGTQAYSIISSDDKLPQSQDFIFGGSADGAGWLRAQDGKGFIYVTNHEDNFAVSRITFDQTLKPVKGGIFSIPMEVNGGLLGYYHLRNTVWLFLTCGWKVAE
jgi:hypothetical protein